MPESCIVLIDTLVALRKAKGWSQQELSEACGMTQSAIARVENKRNTPTIVTLCKIANALGASLSVTEDPME